MIDGSVFKALGSGDSSELHSCCLTFLSSIWCLIIIYNYGAMDNFVCGFIDNRVHIVCFSSLLFARAFFSGLWSGFARKLPPRALSVFFCYIFGVPYVQFGRPGPTEQIKNKKQKHSRRQFEWQSKLEIAELWAESCNIRSMFVTRDGKKIRRLLDLSLGVCARVCLAFWSNWAAHVHSSTKFEWHKNMDKHYSTDPGRERRGGGTNMRPTWSPHEATLGAKWGQLRAKLGPFWSSNFVELRTQEGRHRHLVFGCACAAQLGGQNEAILGPTWGQLEANLDPTRDQLAVSEISKDTALSIIRVAMYHCSGTHNKGTWVWYV